MDIPIGETEKPKNNVIQFPGVNNLPQPVDAIKPPQPDSLTPDDPYSLIPQELQGLPTAPSVKPEEVVEDSQPQAVRRHPSAGNLAPPTSQN